MKSGTRVQKYVRCIIQKLNCCAVMGQQDYNTLHDALKTIPTSMLLAQAFKPCHADYNLFQPLDMYILLFILIINTKYVDFKIITNYLYTADTN